MIGRAARRAAATLARQGGFSSAETAMTILAMSVLSASVAPQIEEYLEHARTVKARTDVRVIALSVLRLRWDLGRVGAPDTVPPALLVSEGSIPAARGAAARPWTRPLGVHGTEQLSAHLIDNAADYPLGRQHPRPWRGPYLERLSADPWGSRYAVNVGVLADEGGYALLVVSAGADTRMDTPFQTVELDATGDDVISIVGRSRQ